MSNEYIFASLSFVIVSVWNDFMCYNKIYIYYVKHNYIYGLYHKMLKDSAYKAYKHWGWNKMVITLQTTF